MMRQNQEQSMKNKMIFKYNLCENILNSQNHKYLEELQDYPEEKVRKRSESNQIPLYLSNSSFQYEQKQRNSLDKIDSEQLDFYLNDDLQQLDYSSANEEVNHKQQENNKISHKKNYFANEYDINNNNINNNNSSGVLCRNRKLFTQKGQSKQRTNTQEKVQSNKQERLYSVDKCSDHLFTLYNPLQDLEDQQHLLPAQKQINTEEVYNQPISNNIILNYLNNQEAKQQVNQMLKRENNTYQTSENQDDYNQDFYLTNTVEQNNNINNICDITTITDSVQANEDYKILSYNCQQKKKNNNDIDSSDNSFEMDLNKQNKISTEINVKKQIQDKKVDGQIRVINNKQSQYQQKQSLSQIIHDKEKELIDLKEKKRKREEINNKNPEEHIKQIKELKKEICEKEVTIMELKSKIKIYELNTPHNEKSDKLLLIIKEKEQIIMELQREIKNKICDQESYKDKIKLYHEQSVKQQTNDIQMCQLNSTIKQQQYQIDKFEMIKKQKDDYIQQLEDQLNQIKNQNKQNQEELLNYKNENYELSIQNKDLKKNVDALQKQLTEIRQNFDQLDQENIKIKDQYNKKVQEFNQNQEIKICNEIDKKIAQTFTYQFTEKDYTLGNEQMKVQLQQVNQDEQCHNDIFDIGDEQQYQQQIGDQFKNTKEYFIDNANNSQQHKINSFNSSHQNFNQNMKLINQDSRQMKPQLNVSTINLSNEVCDVPISPAKVYYQARQKERNYSQENNLLSYYPQSQNKVKTYIDNDNETLLKLNSAQNQNIVARPRHQRSFSSYDNYQRPSSSLTNYSNVPSSYNQGMVSHTVHNNSHENNIQYNTSQPLHERNVNNNNHFQSANNFYNKSTENNQNHNQSYYVHPSQTIKQNNIYQNKENTLQRKQSLNQTYEYITHAHVRNNSPLNSTIKQKQQNTSTNDKISQLSYGKFRYGVPPLPMSHQSTLTSQNRQFMY